MVRVTYRWPHWAPQPRLPLQTVERERASPPGPPGTCPVGTCPPLLPGTHLFSFHLGGDHGPVRADDDAGLPLLPLQEQRRWEGTRRDQAPSCDRAGVTWWPGRTGDQECDHPTGCRWPGAVTFSPGAPWGPADPWSPFGPTGPCRKDTEPTSFPTHQRQAPHPPSTTTTLQQSTAGPATTAATRATPRSPAVSPTHREASEAWSALQREAEMLLRANPLFPKNGVPSWHC